MKTLYILLALAVVLPLAAIVAIGTDAPRAVAEFVHEKLFEYLGSSGLVLAMTTLAVNKPRDYQLGETEFYPVVATDIIYEGAAVGENGSGYSRPLVAGDAFQGFAQRKADNATGAAGAINVEVKTRGRIQLAVVGASAVTANDRPLVYASDDDTFTLTASTNSPIGRVSRWISGTTCIVEFSSALAIAEAARAAGDA